MKERDWLDVAKIIRDSELSEAERKTLSTKIANKISSLNQFFNHRKFITVASDTLPPGWPNRIPNP